MTENVKNSIETKDQILYAAKAEFAEKGFDGARMGSISKRAGVNQALIHYYFDNKEKLFDELLHRFIGFSLIGTIQNYIETNGNTPAVKLYLLIYIQIILIMDIIDPDFKKIINRELADEREHAKKIVKEFATAGFEFAEKIIKEGIKTGEFETADTLFVVMAINSLCWYYTNNKTVMEGTPYYRRIYEDKQKTKIINFFIEHIFKALKPENKKLTIPVLSRTLTDGVDNFLKEIRKTLEWRIQGI